MIALTLLLAAAGAAPHPAPIRVQAIATVRILKAAIVSASVDPTLWHETSIRLPDGTIERLRIVDLP
jgi:hypothetical protein